MFLLPAPTHVKALQVLCLSRGHSTWEDVTKQRGGSVTLVRPGCWRVVSQHTSMFTGAEGSRAKGSRAGQGRIRVPPPPPCISHALVQATVGVGTVIILYVI